MKQAQATVSIPLLCMGTIFLTLSLLVGCAAPSGQSGAEPRLVTHGNSRSLRKQGGVEVNPTTRGQADAIMRNMEALEKAQMADDSEAVGRTLAELQHAANESAFVKLRELLAYLQVWERILAQRGSQLQESSADRESKQKDAEGTLSGSAEFRFESGQPTGSASAKGNLSGKSGSRTEKSKSVSSSGNKGEAGTRTEKAKCHKELMEAFAALGFRRLVAPDELLGKWLWRWTRGVGPATLLFDLKPGGDMVAELIPDNPKDWPYNAFVRTGNGTWRVLDGKLSIHMEKVLFLSNPVDFMVEREVVSFTPRRLTLEGAEDNVLERPPSRGSSGPKK